MRVQEEKLSGGPEVVLLVPYLLICIFISVKVSRQKYCHNAVVRKN